MWIRQGVAADNRRFRNQTATVFGPELRGRRAPAALLDALDAATSWEAWERLRSSQGLSVARAGNTVRLMVDGLLRTVA